MIHTIVSCQADLVDLSRGRFPCPVETRQPTQVPVVFPSRRPHLHLLKDKETPKTASIYDCGGWVFQMSGLTNESSMGMCRGTNNFVAVDRVRGGREEGVCASSITTR